MNYRAEHNACGWSSRRHVGLSDAERAAIEHWNRCPESEQGACRIVCISAGQRRREGGGRKLRRGSLRGTDHASGAGAALTRNPTPWPARTSLKEGRRAQR